MATALVETRDQAWSPVIERLEAAALDCIQTGLAALADRYHGAGAHLVLGARLGFLATPVPGRPPRVEPSTDQRLAEADELAGLRVAECRDGLDGPALRRFAAGPLYVVADAFDMPWTPYRGQRHMDHSVLLVPAGDEFAVVDPYHNDTQWGPARPGVWRLAAAGLDAAVEGGASAMVVVAGRRPVLDAAKVLGGNAAVLAAAGPDVARYLAAAREALDRVDEMERLVLDVWVLGRSRLLHAAWLATVPGLPAPLLAAARSRAEDWLRLAAQSYVGVRRLQRGSALPPSVIQRLAELLDGDAELAEQLAAVQLPPAAGSAKAEAPRAVPAGSSAGGPGSVPAEAPAGAPVPAEVREVVVDAVRLVLRLEEEAARRPRPFRAIPDFNSFRLVDVIERVELQLGVHLDADDLTQDALQDVDSLSGLFARAVERARR